MCFKTSSSFYCYQFLFLSELTPEQREFQQVARKFTEDEIIPKAAHHDETGEVSVTIITILSKAFLTFRVLHSFFLSFHRLCSKCSFFQEPTSLLESGSNSGSLVFYLPSF